MRRVALGFIAAVSVAACGSSTSTAERGDSSPTQPTEDASSGMPDATSPDAGATDAGEGGAVSHDAAIDHGQDLDAIAPSDADSGNIIVPALACDGVTNDTAALNTALEGAGASGATVLLPAGTCVVGGPSPVHLPSNVMLRGQGIAEGSAGTLLLAAPQVTHCASNASAVCSLIQVGGDGQASAVNVVLADLTIDAGGFGDVGSGAITLSSGSSYVTIEAIAITDMPQYGIVVSGADRFRDHRARRSRSRIDPPTATGSIRRSRRSTSWRASSRRTARSAAVPSVERGWTLPRARRASRTTPCRTGFSGLASRRNSRRFATIS